VASHESSTGLPRAGELLSWEQAAPVIWGALRRAEARDRAHESAMRIIDDQLHELDKKLAELVVAKKTELALVQELREEIRRVRHDHRGTQQKLVAIEAADEAEEKAEDRRVRREGLRTAGIGAGGAVGAVGLLELVKQLLALLAG
jgi:chromosome segregation ATPase